jgi:hypothetical protein
MSAHASFRSDVDRLVLDTRDAYIVGATANSRVYRTTVASRS